MQFPVPQFTEVEDHIIGPLTIKQFGIVFGAGIIVFLGYSATKSILVLLFLFMLFGVPALGLAFAKINGRPVYNSIGVFSKFLASQKVLVFHKEALGGDSGKSFKDAQLSQAPVEEAKNTQNPQAHLKEIQALLAKTETAQQDIVDKL